MIVECPFCGNDVTVDKEWAEKNKRIFCPNCCKSFDVMIDSNESHSETLD